MRPYYIQIRKRDGTIIEEIIDTTQENDNLIIEPDGTVHLVIRYLDS